MDQNSTNNAEIDKKGFLIAGLIMILIIILYPPFRFIGTPFEAWLAMGKLMGIGALVGFALMLITGIFVWRKNTTVLHAITCLLLSALVGAYALIYAGLMAIDG